MNISSFSGSPLWVGIYIAARASWHISYFMPTIWPTIKIVEFTMVGVAYFDDVMQFNIFHTIKESNLFYLSNVIKLYNITGTGK